MSALIGFLHEIRENFRKGAYINEASVRAQIVLPVLAKLGWSTSDPRQITLEYPLKPSKRKKGQGPAPKVDLALFNLFDTSDPQGIIEIKDPGNTIGDEPLFEYAFHTESTIRIQTDGKSWRFYYLQSGSICDNRLICTLEIEKHDLDETAKALSRYLSFKNFQSGKAIEYAQRDQNQRKNLMRARDAIPHAWNRLIDGNADSRLAKMLIEETSSISGYAPQDEDVMAFISNLRDRGATDFIRSPQSPFARKSSASDLVSQYRQSSPEREARRSLDRGVPGESTIGGRSKKTLSFVFKGKRHEAKSQVDAYARIIVLMERENPGFLDILAPQVSFSKTKALARSKYELASPEILEKENVAIPIIDGWWLYRKINRETKIKNLKIACRIIGIPFGKPDGLVVDF